MRPELLYLTDIVDAANAIQRFVGTRAREDFLGDEILHSAVLQKLIVIGEAASRLSPAFHAQYPEVPWADIIGFRNIAIHAYFAVSWDIVWVTATLDVPALRDLVLAIPNQDFRRA